MSVAHSLYTGVSLSGKTTMARILARQLHAKGQPGLVYDPTLTETAGGGWGYPDELIYTDRDAFLERLEDPKQGPAHIFVDECHEIFGHDQPENFWLLSKGRHFGYFMHCITQRPNRMHPTARTNCHRVFMFRLSQDDAKMIGADYGHNDLHKINLDTGDFLLFNSGSSAISRGNVFQLVK